MIAGLLFGPDRTALATVGMLLRELINRSSRVECRLALCTTEADLRKAVQGGMSWQLLCVDIGMGESIDSLRLARELCPEANLMLLVDRHVSPMTYIRPGIMPSCLLERPADTEQIRSALEDFIGYLLAQQTPDDGGGSFAIEEKDGVTRVPFRNIVCFESRAKRISVRLRREEYAYYDTLDRLQQALPEEFVRCHRSYIVNVTHVRRLSLSHNLVEMDDGTSVPVSRSYKAAVKERLT